MNEAWKMAMLMAGTVAATVEVLRQIPWIDALIKARGWLLYVLIILVGFVVGMYPYLDAFYMTLSPIIQQAIITLMIIVYAIGGVGLVFRGARKVGNGG